MNLRGGMALIRKTFLSYTASRGFFWTLAFGWLMMPLINMFVWVIAAGEGSVMGFTGNDFVVYYMALILVNQLTYPVSHWTVGDNIFNGTFSYWLLRPMPPIYEAIAADIAAKVVCMPFTIVFILGIVMVLGVSFSTTAVNIILFAICLLLAQLLRFMVAYSISLVALYTSKVNSLLGINDTLLFLFSGQVIPTMLMPGIIGTISGILPYRYMLGFPVEVLLGKLSMGQITWGIVFQLIWLFIIIGLNRVIWKKGIKHYSSVGG